MMDSSLYGHLWGTEEVRALFSDRGRTQLWLDVLAALAAAQGELGIIPRRAAAEIAGSCRVELVDMEEVAAGTRRTGHSTLGLIQVLRGLLSPDAAEWVYYGATVQDVTDTWTGLVMRRIAEIMLRDLRRIEGLLLELASIHRDTVMAGRTHGQPGLPITFGFKAAVWAAEIRRHIDRWTASGERLAVGQLAGAVGTCSFWGAHALELQRRFCERLDLRPPEMTWLTARDRIAEFTTLLAMVAGTIAKIGREVYTLQRPEIGELRESFRPGVVGSITMPHKRNPELSEHLGTLSRVVRSAAGVALEGMVHDHERDGAAWKAEWAFVPEACMAAVACTAFGAELIAGLEVDAGRMARNVREQAGYVMSEPVMAALSGHLGKHTAHEVVYEAAMAGVDRGLSFRSALVADPRVSKLLGEEQLDRLLDPSGALGQAGALVDRVVERGRAAQARESQRPR
jgi:adenylosuccinate lyase